MAFKRARSEQQKQQRMQAILKAADGLLDRRAYRDITMADIAAEVGFTRANLVHYVETKEEIFLLLFLQDMDALCAELPLAFPPGAPVSIEDFAARFAALYTGHKNFCRLGALLTTIIEANIGAEKLVGYKRHMLTQMAQVAGGLCGLFRFLTPETAGSAVQTLMHYSAGLYPSAHPSPAQREAMQALGYGGQLEDFATPLRDFLTTLLYGYRATAQQKPGD